MSAAIHALVHQLQTGDVVLGLAVVLLVSAGAARLVGRRGRGYGRFAWQIGAILGLEQAYEFSRGRIPHETDIALLNAIRILDLEWQHGFFIEGRIERFFLQFQPLMNAIDLFYVLAHVGVTIGVLVYIYFAHREQYAFTRNLMMVTTAIALVAFYVYPTAPPRMLPEYGFFDPLQLHHLAAVGGDQPDSYTYNPYAAFPSLHVGYALVVSLSLFLAERRRWVRTLCVLYPITMAAVVVISGNHWLLDVAGAGVTVALAVLLLSAARRVRGAAADRVRRLLSGPSEVAIP